MPSDTATVLRQVHARQDVHVGFDQGVWWSVAGGTLVLIDSMSDNHRHNACAMLLRNAATLLAYEHYRVELNDWMSYVAAGQAAFERGSWGPVSDDPPTFQDVRERVQPLIERGWHLTWLRSTDLFRRLSRDLQVPDPLPARTPDRGVPGPECEF